VETTRWIARAEHDTWVVGDGDEEIATCKYREDALRLKNCVAHTEADWAALDEAMGTLKIIKQTDPGVYDELIDPVLKMIAERGKVFLTGD
jgi:hypothetical protein